MMLQMLPILLNALRFRCTRCTWQVTSSKFCLPYSQFTGDFRPRREDRRGERDRTLSTVVSSTSSRRKFWRGTGKTAVEAAEGAAITATTIKTSGSSRWESAVDRLLNSSNSISNRIAVENKGQNTHRIQVIL